MKFFVIKRRTLTLFFIICCSIGVTFFWLTTSSSTITTFNQQQEHVREIHIVTGELKGKTADGKELEAYRWDAGTIFVQKDENVKINILGISGKEHPFIIEGTHIKGTVKQGKETIIPIKFQKEGVYRLICLTHSDKMSNGPMIAYIIVD